MENVVGRRDYWPNYVLRLLFCIRCTRAARKTLVAFMYGNCVDPNDAVACYRECNPYFRDNVDNERSFREWYRYWDASYERRMLSS